MMIFFKTKVKGDSVPIILAHLLHSWRHDSNLQDIIRSILLKMQHIDMEIRFLSTFKILLMRDPSTLVIWFTFPF
jgi:hypothetical protein